MRKFKKLIILGIVVLIVSAAAIFGYFKYQEYQEYHATYIIIDEKEYLRASTELDLSGQSIGELEKYKELTGLTYLDLRQTGVTQEQVDDLQRALPDCRILWSVPFQDDYVDNESTILKISSLSEEDFPTLDCFPYLSAISANDCRDYDAIMKLMELRPELLVSYNVSFSGTDYNNSLEVLDITDASADELMAGLKYLPSVTNVNLAGTMPSNEQMLELKEAYPGVVFYWEFELLGIPVNSLTEFVDLSRIKLESTEELESMLPLFYNLTQVDMVDCGLSNKYMDALNKRNPGTKFVWTVSVGGKTVRTDIKYFMPVKYKMKNFGSSSAQNLRYCTDIVAIDFGHYGGISDLSFVEYMPNLKYLLLCETSVSDITPIGTCKNLLFLEVFMTKTIDFWPLINCTSLEDLNLAQTPGTKNEEGQHTRATFGDITPLLQMTWLDRLWLPSTSISSTYEKEIQEALPDTIVMLDGANLDCTGRGWRQSRNYYDHRDIMGMWYMVH